jgi:hypothetical protein
MVGDYMSMAAPTRRSLLRISGSLLATSFLAGCIGGSSPSEEAGGTGTTTEEPTPTATEEPTEISKSTAATGNDSSGSPDSEDTGIVQIESQYSEPQKVVAVNHQGVVRTRDVEYRDSRGTEDTAVTPSSAETMVTNSTRQTTGDERIFNSSDGIQIWNNSTKSRQITVSIAVESRPANPLNQETYAASTPANPLLEKAYSVDPDAFIKIKILKPGDYEVSVGVGEQATKTIQYMTDNCNSQSLSIVATEDGSIKSSVMSTLVACTNVGNTSTPNNNSG